MAGCTVPTLISPDYCTFPFPSTQVPGPRCIIECILYGILTLNPGVKIRIFIIKRKTVYSWAPGTVVGN